MHKMNLYLRKILQIQYRRIFVKDKFLETFQKALLNI